MPFTSEREQEERAGQDREQEQHFKEMEEILKPLREEEKEVREWLEGIQKDCKERIREREEGKAQLLSIGYCTPNKKLNNMASQGLSLREQHHVNVKINAQSGNGTLTALQYAKYATLTAELSCEMAKRMVTKDTPGLQNTISMATHYVLPISHIAVSAASIAYTPANAPLAILNIARQMMKIPEVQSFFLKPNIRDSHAYERWLIGAAIMRMFNDDGVLHKLSQVTGLSVAYRDILKKFFDNADILPNGNILLMLRVGELAKAIYQTSQHIKKDWLEYCCQRLQNQFNSSVNQDFVKIKEDAAFFIAESSDPENNETRVALRKLYIQSLYLQHRFANTTEYQKVSEDEGSLYQAVACYVAKDAEELKGLARDADVLALAKAINRPIVIISSDKAKDNFSNVPKEMYELSGEPIFILQDKHNYRAMLIRGEAYFERDYQQVLQKENQKLKVKVNAELAELGNTREQLYADQSKTYHSINENIDHLQAVRANTKVMLQAVNAKLTLFSQQAQAKKVPTHATGGMEFFNDNDLSREDEAAIAAMVAGYR